MGSICNLFYFSLQFVISVVVPFRRNRGLGGSGNLHAFEASVEYLLSGLVH